MRGVVVLRPQGCIEVDCIDTRVSPTSCQNIRAICKRDIDGNSAQKKNRKQRATDGGPHRFPSSSRVSDWSPLLETMKLFSAGTARTLHVQPAGFPVELVATMLHAWDDFHLKLEGVP
jgi:hypothetical protein